MKRTKSQLNAISRYYADLSLEIWRNTYYLLSNNEDKNMYCLIDKKYKYVAVKNRHFRNYLREKYGDEQASKIK